MKQHSKTGNIRTIGIDLAKNVFHLHGVDGKGRVVMRKKLSRSKLSALMANHSYIYIHVAQSAGGEQET